LPRRNLAILVSVAALLVGAVGCTDEEPADAPHDGPLRLGGEMGTLCIPAGSSTEFTLGLDAVQNSTKADINVDRVRLIGADNATMVDGYLAPILGHTLIGAIPGWPPKEGATAAFDQKKTVPTTISAGKDANLVVHVKATAPAEIKAVEVTYTSDGKPMRVQSTTSLTIRDTCS
jgi:hypothetical protein